jgi:hypothetical protein
VIAYHRGMEEREACALLKARFEAAGFRIEENRPFDEQGVRFEMDGFDPKQRVGYEYVTTEAGDGWDVDGTVIAALEMRKQAGELFVLVIDEADAPDAETLGEQVDEFLDELREREVISDTKAKPAKQAKPKPKAKPKAKAPAKRAKRK